MTRALTRARAQGCERTDREGPSTGGLSGSVVCEAQRAVLLYRRREAEFVIETLSTVPKVLRVREFLSATESAALRQLAAAQEMKDIVKQGPPGCEDSDTGCDVFRNETTTWLAPTFGHWTVSLSLSLSLFHTHMNACRSYPRILRNHLLLASTGGRRR